MSQYSDSSQSSLEAFSEIQKEARNAEKTARLIQQRSTTPNFPLASAAGGGGPDP